MGIIVWARAFAQGIGERCFKVQTALRVGLIRATAVLKSLPETAREQIRHWRGKSVEFPVEEQRVLLAEYYDRFEQLAELICDAAFAGEGAPFQERYTALRRWLLRAYPQIKPYLTGHMNCDPSDSEFGMRVAGRPTDAMEALFAAETIEEILRYDQGNLIGRLERARSALYRYADYLREIL
ncbi:MAG: hypothetical protein KatS3mg016_1052 [Fimbriimonadales bacterium]|nr:MAG: hypothetical protein KatS3mg016_1052 [Fimbriimonadales bacterium]